GFLHSIPVVAGPLLDLIVNIVEQLTGRDAGIAVLVRGAFEAFGYEMGENGLLPIFGDPRALPAVAGREHKPIGIGTLIEATAVQVVELAHEVIVQLA